MPTIRYNPRFFLPDQGQLDNPGWLEALSVVPYGAKNWVTNARLTARQTLTDSDIRGIHTHRANGTNGWKIYYGSGDSLWEIEPATWTETDRTGNGIVVALQEDNSGSPDYVDETVDLEDAGASDAQPFPSGSGVDDAFYMGFHSTPVSVTLNVGTVGTGTYTVTWEYWDGTAWSSLSGVTDGTNAFKASGSNTVAFTRPADWARTTVNSSVSLYFIRAKRDGGTVTADPLLTSGELPYTPNATTGWQFVAFGPQEIAVGGYSQAPQIRQDDAGSFGDMITNSEPETSTGNWPPKPKFVSQWGNQIAISNITDVGPASAFGNVSPNLVWISKTEDPATFTTEAEDEGSRSAYFYLVDDYGDISAMAGGAQYGVVFKPTATYRVSYGGTFRADFQLVSANLGCSFPNSLVWVGDDLYFMSNAGPAVMRQTGVELLGADQILRSLFDITWVVDSNNINTDLSAPYALHAGYSSGVDAVTWYYRKDQDAPDYALHYSRSTGRFSASPSRTLYDGANSISSNVHGVTETPILNLTPFSGGKDVFILGKNSGGSIVLYEPDPSGSVYWKHNPTFTGPDLILHRDKNGVPYRTIIRAIRPLYSLNQGESNAPEITVSITPKNKAGDALGTTVSTAVEDEFGRYVFTGQEHALYHRPSISFGNATLDYVQNLADVLQGLEIEFEIGQPIR